MTVRAVILGVLLGFAVAGLSYFNDQVIRQTFLIGNHLPASVFGTGLILLLVVNPCVRLLGNMAQRAAHGQSTATTWGDRLILRPGEVAIILALGLAVCAWPGSNLMRYFPQLMSLPTYRLPTQTSWMNTGVMSYVPGQSMLFGKGHVADPDLAAAALAEGAGDASSVPDRVFQRFQEQSRAAVQVAAERPLLSAEVDWLVLGLNAAVADPALLDGLYPPDAPEAVPPTARRLFERTWRGETLDRHDIERLNRLVMVHELPGLLGPPPGSGVLLQAHGREAELVGTLVAGAGDDWVPLREVPWDAWWPSLRLWGGALLLASLATLCLIVIVHPQWAHRELLRYPTVEFVHAMTQWKPGRSLPDIASSKLFWFGVGPVAVMHLVNGLGGYWLDLPMLQRTYDFTAMRDLFPMAARVPGSDHLFHPTIYPSVIGFGFFVTTRVSLSIGLSLVFWTILGAWLLSFGTPLDNGKLTIGSNGTSLRFGAYVAMTLVILYLGRTYYLDVTRGALGFKRRSSTPDSAVWAARLGALCAALSVYMLVAYANLSPMLAVLFVGLFLMMLLVLARINVETGMFYAQPDWIPGIVLAGFFGLAGLGAENLVVIIIASQVFAADPREGISPYLANALRLGDRVFTDKPTTPGRLAPLLAAMIAMGLVVSIVATLWVQYGRGFNPADGFAMGTPISTIDRAASSLTTLDTRGELATVARLTGFEHLSHIRPNARTLTYAGIGFGLLMLCAIARIRLPWWPLHPVIFLVWGAYPANLFAVSFLLAAAIKASVTKVGGAKAYEDTKPLMVGLIAGDILMIIVWSIIGTIYYFNTNQMPPTYRILPI